MDKPRSIDKVVSNERLCPKFYRLRFDAKAILKKAQPGQFVHIRVRDGLEPFLRRPFSISRAEKYVEILYEVVGPGTQALAAKQKGDALDVLGPLGKPFRMPPAGTKQVVMIGGGIGVAPFLFLSDVLRRGQASSANGGRCLSPVILYGGRTQDHVFPMTDFKRNGCRVHVATDDGSAGTHGRVSALFSKIKADSKTTFLYACGPKPMIASVQDFARRHSLRGEICCEETMACGIGVCLGCSIPTKSGYKTVCCDGPVFNIDEVEMTL